MAFKAMEMDPEKIDPSKYKDMFENPKKFDEAWNHHDEFQRKKWREEEVERSNHEGIRQDGVEPSLDQS